MAKDKSKNRKLGTVVKKLPSGFWETSSGHKIPALHGIKSGDKVELVDGDYVINGGVADKEESKDSGNLADVNARFEKLETELGEVKTELGEVKTELGEVKTELGEVKTEQKTPKTSSGDKAKV